MSHREIDLNRNQLKYLKAIRNGNFKIPQNEIDFLLSLDLIYLTSLPSEPVAEYALTEEAYSYLTFVPKDRVRTWYPYVVSTLALIVAVISLYFSLVSIGIL